MRAVAIAASSVVAVFALASCGTTPASPSAATAASPSPADDRSLSPSPSGSLSPLPAPTGQNLPGAAPGPSASYAIVVDQPSGKIGLISTTGAVVATAATTPRPSQWGPCGTATAGGKQPRMQFPTVPVSSSRGRAYFLDGTLVRWLDPMGRTGTAYSIAAGPSLIAGFAVSPDDGQIAYTLVDGSTDPPQFSLRVALIPDGSAKEIYASTASLTIGLIPRPIGWYRGHLLLRLMAACGPDGVAAIFYHLVDATTAVRLVDLGANGGCFPLSYQELPSAPGIPCTSGNPINVYAYDGRTLQIPNPHALTNAMVDSTGTRAIGVWINDLDLTGPNGPRSFPNTPFRSGGWIDADHFLANGSQPKVLTVSTGALVTTPAEGEFVGSLPGGLDPLPG